MSVRIVTHPVALPRSQVARRRRWVKQQQPVGRARPPRASRNGSRGPESRPHPRFGGTAWPGRSRSGWLARFEDDRDLTGIKLVLAGMVAVIAMALEVPW